MNWTTPADLKAAWQRRWARGELARAVVQQATGAAVAAVDAVVACISVDDIASALTQQRIIAVATGGNIDPDMFRRALDTL